MSVSYLNLCAGGALARLTILRGKAAYTNAPDVNLPPSRRFVDWRDAREHGFNDDLPQLSAGSAVVGNNVRIDAWYTFDGPQFRDEKFADEVEGARIDHTGWFKDADCSSTLRGIVARLPHDMFISGYYNSENGERAYFGELIEDQVTAARLADSRAERMAEAEKEHSERWHAAHDLDDEITQCAVEVSRLFAVRNHRTLGHDAREALAYAVDSLRGMRTRRAAEFGDIETV